MAHRVSKKVPARPHSAPPPRPRRRGLQAAAAVLAACGLGFAAWWFLRPAGGPPAPVILISIDTLRADHLPVYGYTRVRTPAIDALAADGVIFDRAYAHSPQTLPSHTSILTGKLPFETGVRDNVGFTVRASETTLASMLRGHGYATGGVVSAFVLRKETGIDKGFDFFDSTMPPAAPDMPMGEVQRSGTDSLAVAERWMEGLTSPKFFLFFHDYDPHAPYTPPARFSQYAPYDGEIAYADEVVGQLIAWLKQRGWYDRAAIILLADHGEGLGDHGEQEHGLFLYNETIHVPLIIKLPGSKGAGRRVSTPVQHIDLVPTVLDWLGIPRPSGLRGRSLRSLLDDRGSGPAESELYAESLYGRYHFGWSELYALTDARYRFIKAPRPELYDLQNDPHEAQNIAGGRPQAVIAARQALEQLLARASVQAPAPVPKEDLERMQALGYVGTQVSIAPERPGELLADPKDKVQALEKIRHATMLVASRNYDGAATVLRDVLAVDPEMKDAWLQLGVVLVRSTRYPEALAAFKRLVEVDPTDANSLISVANVLVSMGKFDEAQAHAELALRKAAQADVRARTSACEVLVRAALAHKDRAAARRYAALAQESDPGFPLPAFVDGLIFHDDKQFDQALPRLVDAARGLQGHSFAIQDLFFYLGDTFGNLGREAEAVAAFKEELRLFPANTRARSSLAVMYRVAGRNAEAEQELDRLLRLSPTPEAYRLAVRTWTVFGERGHADAVRAAGTRLFGARAMASAGDGGR